MRAWLARHVPLPLVAGVWWLTMVAFTVLAVTWVVQAVATWEAESLLVLALAAILLTGLGREWRHAPEMARMLRDRA